MTGRIAIVERESAAATATATAADPRTHRHTASEEPTPFLCPWGCEPAPCELCAPPALDPSDGDLRLGVALGVAFLVIWLVSVIGLVLSD